jgi:hypothetical protein
MEFFFQDDYSTLLRNVDGLIPDYKASRNKEIALLTLIAV